MEVSYFPEGGSITDYVCEIFGTKVGVSVTRAMKFRGGDFTEEDAEHLLNKKLKGEQSFRLIVVPTKSDSDVRFCLQLLSKTLTCIVCQN